MNDGGPAFPKQSWQNPYNGEIEWGNNGMSLRDWFAGMALQDRKGWSYGPDNRAKEAYGVADSMLKERES